MAGTLTIRITEAAGQIHDLRYRLMWSARLGGRFLGSGHARFANQCEDQALDLASPDEVDWVNIDYHSREGGQS